LGGCLVIYLKTLLKPSPPPLGQNFALFKIQMKFGRIHQIFFFSFSFSPFSLQNSTKSHPSRLLSLPLSYSPCLIHLHTKEGGSPRQSCQDRTPPLSLTPALSNPQPASSRHPGECQDPTCKPLSTPTSPLLSLEARGHPARARADQGAGGKPAPATTPPEPSSHRHRCPMACCRPRRPLAIP
jgi:hypothetical protein